MTHSRDKDKKKEKKKTVRQEDTFKLDPFGEGLVRRQIESEKIGRKKSKGFNFGAFGQPSGGRNSALERMKQEQRAKKELTKKAAAEAKAARLAEEKRLQKLQKLEEAKKAAIKEQNKTTVAGRFYFRENFQEKKSIQDNPVTNFQNKLRREETAKNKFFGKHKTNAKPFAPSPLTKSSKPKKPGQG